MGLLECAKWAGVDRALDRCKNRVNGFECFISVRRSASGWITYICGRNRERKPIGSIQKCSPAVAGLVPASDVRSQAREGREGVAFHKCAIVEKHNGESCI